MFESLGFGTMVKTVRSSIVGTYPPCHIRSRIEERRAKARILRYCIRDFLSPVKNEIKVYLETSDRNADENPTNQMIS